MIKKYYVQRLRHSLITTALLVLGVSTASAKVYVNSMCHMKVGEQMSDILGDENKDKKYPLASISKIVTSLWAVDKLGANYRFQTKLHLKKVDDEIYDLHIEGGRDPIMGRNAAYFIISELNRSDFAVKKIRNLTFDQNFIIDWRAEETPRIGGNTPFYRTTGDQTANTLETLKSGFTTPVMGSRYKDLKQKAFDAGIIMENEPGLTAENISYLSKTNFQEGAKYDVTLVYRSAPLYVILKRMNNQSNNYIADHLFWNLGGTAEFNKFIEKTMKLDTSDLDFNLGSGNNAGYIFDPSKNIYNQGSCSAMIKVLWLLDKTLSKSDLQLCDVMAVAGEDSESTIRNYSGSFYRSTVAKTGSVNVAKTLTGTIKTKEGSFYFTILVNTSGRSEWGAGSSLIKQELNSLIEKYGGKVKEDYEEHVPLPFDSQSKLIRESVLRMTYNRPERRKIPTGDALP